MERVALQKEMILDNKSKWQVIHIEMDKGWRGYLDWWEIQSDDMTFESNSKEDAEWLCDTLNKLEKTRTK